MKDQITTAYVIKGAVQTKKFGKFVSAIGQGEIDAIQYLIEVADILETQYEKRNSDDFDHVVFAYEVAEPFGVKVAKAVVKAGNMIGTPYMEFLANKLLDEVSRSDLSEDAQRIKYDKQFRNSNDLANYYHASNMNKPEHPMFPLGEWRAEVVRGNTRDGYWSWVYNCVHNWEEAK